MPEYNQGKLYQFKIYWRNKRSIPALIYIRHTFFILPATQHVNSRYMILVFVLLFTNTNLILKAYL